MSKRLRRLLFSMSMLVLALGFQTSQSSSTMFYYRYVCWDFGGWWCPAHGEAEAACQSAYGTSWTGCNEGSYAPEYWSHTQCWNDPNQWFVAEIVCAWD